ncbi:hypothetical protein [Streptomyces platensis]|uniref:DUF7239 family protein n=1 Tax=Streptomyces platensis TaxID=58346 RepID=UPI002E273CA1
MADARESRLPKWAQEELRRLRQSLAVERKRAAELRGEVGETNVHVQNYGSDDQPLPSGASVKFHLDPEVWNQYITVRVESGQLWLHGGGSLVIHPHVSNALWVGMGER